MPRACSGEPEIELWNVVTQGTVEFTSMINNSGDIYLDITAFANSTPIWVQTFANVGTDAGMFIFFALLAWRWWSTRDTAHLLAPLAVVFAYGASEAAKSLIQEERPCRAIGTPVVAECPEIGDWSFPSNHATTAVACAVTLTIIWRQVAKFVLPLAALMAFSRVFVGVHYPHDVVAGAMLGTAVAVLVMFAIRRLVAAPVPATR
jgi:membrane-associated phospholipid phosphatase